MLTGEGGREPVQRMSPPESSGFPSPRNARDFPSFGRRRTPHEGQEIAGVGDFRIYRDRAARLIVVAVRGMSRLKTVLGRAN